MQSLFRKNRKLLLKESKLSKYFKYAFGEVFLVVLGILIALQLNNWNENRKLNDKKKVLISNLNIEFKENSGQLNDLTENYKNHIQKLDLFFEHAYALPLSISVDSLKILAKSFAMAQIYLPELGILEEAKSNGNLSLIKSKSLFKAITKFQTHYEYYLNFQERFSIGFYEGSWWEFRKSSGSITTLMNFDDGFYKNPIRKNLDQKAYIELVNSNLVTALLENQYLITSGVKYHLQEMAVFSNEIVEILSEIEK